MKAARTARARLRSSVWVKVDRRRLINTYSQPRNFLFSGHNPESPETTNPFQLNPKFLKNAEWTMAIVLSALVLFLLFVRATHAGALWRDECDSLELARMPGFSDILHNLKFTSFPILFPTTVRFFTAVFGTTDASLRCFGLLVGVCLLAVGWFNA